MVRESSVGKGSGPGERPFVRSFVSQVSLISEEICSSKSKSKLISNVTDSFDQCFDL